MKIYEQLEQAKREIEAAEKGQEQNVDLIYEMARAIRRLEESVAYLVAQEKARAGKSHSTVFSRAPDV